MAEGLPSAISFKSAASRAGDAPWYRLGFVVVLVNLYIKKKKKSQTTNTWVPVFPELGKDNVGLPTLTCLLASGRWGELPAAGHRQAAQPPPRGEAGACYTGT